MPNTPIPGRIANVRWKKTKNPDNSAVVSPTFTDITDYVRNLTVNDQADPSETTTYSAARTGRRTFISNLANSTGSFEFMRQEGDAIGDLLEPNATGDLEVGWEGNDTGATLTTYEDTIITGVERTAPFDNVQMSTVNLQFSGVPVESVVP